MDLLLQIRLYFFANGPATADHTLFWRMDLLLVLQIRLYFGEHSTRSQVDSGGDFQSGYALYNGLVLTALTANT
jgi:hypothetical protein